LPAPPPAQFHTDAHQHDADHGDDGAGHHRGEETQHVCDERCDAEAENAADQDGAIDSLGSGNISSTG
jgi:hypothetical protein